jgi:hypothetical protein
VARVHEQDHAPRADVCLEDAVKVFHQEGGLGHAIRVRVVGHEVEVLFGLRVGGAVGGEEDEEQVVRPRLHDEAVHRLLQAGEGGLLVGEQEDVVGGERAAERGL